MKRILVPVIKKTRAKDLDKDIDEIIENLHNIAICFNDVIKYLKEVDELFYK